MAGRPLGVHALLLYQEGVKVKEDGVEGGREGERGGCHSVWTLNLIDFVYVQPGECECTFQRDSLQINSVGFCVQPPSANQEQFNFLC